MTAAAITGPTTAHAPTPTLSPRQTEARFQALIEHSDEAITLVDERGAVMYASPAIERILGYDPVEYLTLDWPSMLHPEDADRNAREFPGLATSPGRSIRYTWRQRHKDGAYRWIEGTITNLLHDPAVRAIVGNLRDATERKRDEDHLLRLNTRLRLLLDLATRVGPSLRLGAPLEDALRTLLAALPEAESAAVLLYDSETDRLIPRAFVGIGPAYGRIRLRPGEGLSGATFQLGRPLRGEEEASIPALRSTLSPENTRAVDEACGGRLHERSVSVPLRIHAGQIVGVLTLGSHDGTFSDDDLRVLEGVAAQLAVALDNAHLYDRLRAQADELHSALGELRQTQTQVVQQERLRALGQMASGIAHDLNNTLAPVVGYSELLLNGATGRDREYLSLIHTGAVDAAHVVGRLREFYRPRDEAAVSATVEVAPLLDQVVSLTRPKWRDEALAQGRPIHVDVQVGGAPHLRGSHSELREALTNLVLNAVDALPNGGTVSLTARSDGQTTTLEVSDTGTGMPEDVRRRCLEPFFTTKGELGTGLGLSMVHGVVRRHAGALEIQSAPGAGTTIRLLLPASSPLGAPAQTVPAGGATRPLCVLLADDEPSVRAVVSAMLEADGHAVTTASDGAAAIAALESSHYDLVITDRAMPGGINGDRVALAVKQHHPETPVVLLSGFGELMLAAGERPRGVDAVLGKPLTLVDLRRTLASLAP